MIVDNQQPGIRRLVRTLFDAGTLCGLSDGELLARYAGREDDAPEAAFRVLVERHGPMVLRVCRSILADEHAAHDAFQVTFLTLVRKARALRTHPALGPWLHQAAVRVALCARGAAARRRKHEQRAAAMTPEAVSVSQIGHDAALVHREIDALPERMRAAVVLCCVEGLTHSQAADQLGWPLGTLQSRLARGRERLRSRLTRRGLAPAVALAATVGLATTADAVVPQALLDATVSAAMSRLAVEQSLGAGAASLFQELAKGMIMSRIKLAAVAAIAVFSVGLATYVAQPKSLAALKAQPPVARVAPPAQQDDQSSKLIPTRLNLGTLYQGAIAEASVRIILDEDDEWGEVTAKVTPPHFLKVSRLDIREQEFGDGKKRAINLDLSFDTSRVGNYSSPVRIEYGAHRVEVPVDVRILKSRPNMTKVLVITNGFGDATDDSSYYRPWFDLVDSAKLDVSYFNPHLHHPDIDPVTGRHNPEGPGWLSAYDVILVNGTQTYAHRWTCRALQDFAKQGGRLIVCSSAYLVDSIPHANGIIEAFGLEMMNEDFTKGRTSDDRRWAPFPIAGDNIRRDPLTNGVSTVAFTRCSPVRVKEGSKNAQILFQDPDDPSRGFAAVARDGGEVVVLGPSLLFSWIGEDADGSDNAQFVRNLLTHRRPRQAK